MRQGIHYVKFIKRTKIANFLSNQANLMKAVVFYNYFLRKMKIWVTELDGFTEDFLRLASREIHQTNK